MVQVALRRNQCGVAAQRWNGLPKEVQDERSGEDQQSGDESGVVHCPSLDAFADRLPLLRSEEQLQQCQNEQERENSSHDGSHAEIKGTLEWGRRCLRRLTLFIAPLRFDAKAEEE